RVARPSWPGGELVFATGACAAVLRARKSVDLVYSRDLVSGMFAVELGLPVVYESHGVFEVPWQRAAMRRMVRGNSFLGLVTISKAMIGRFAAIDLLPIGRPIVVAHSPANAVPGAAPRAEAAKPPRIGYVGSLYPGRGVELVVEVAG